MGIDWKRLGAQLKRRREKVGMTQDVLAARIGVRWNTIARIETGKRRPSLDVLERLASALKCRVRDLLPEEEPMAPSATAAERREPSLTGAPTYFRAHAAQAASRATVGEDVNTRRRVRSDYSQPGWHLAIHLHEYLGEEAWAELDAIAAGATSDEAFASELWAFLRREFPGCMKLIPTDRRAQFLRGVYRAIADQRLELDYDVSGLLPDED